MSLAVSFSYFTKSLNRFCLKGDYGVWLGLKRTGKTTDFIWNDGTVIKPNDQEGYEQFDETNTKASGQNIMKPYSNYDCGWFTGKSAAWGVSNCDDELFVVCKW